MASNALIDIFRVKDLRNRILFTAFILVIFRLGANIPIPGVNLTALKLSLMAQETSGTVGIVDYLDCRWRV